MVVDLEIVKTYLGLQGNPEQDTLLQRLTDAACGWLESQTARKFALQGYHEIQVQQRRGGTLVLVEGSPLVSVQSLLIDGTTILVSPDGTSDGYMVIRDVIHLRGSIKLKCTSIVDVTYTAGFQTIPADVVQAVVEIVALNFQGKDRLGQMSRSINGDSVTFAVFQTPATVKTVIDTYKMYRV